MVVRPGAVGWVGGVRKEECEGCDGKRDGKFKKQKGSTVKAGVRGRMRRMRREGGEIN
jgi:hypothetical protein